MNMKFIRNARRRAQFRDRAVDLLSKVFLIGISVLACLWMVSGAHAGSAISITGIKGAAQSNGSYAIDFSLSRTNHSLSHPFLGQVANHLQTL